MNYPPSKQNKSNRILLHSPLEQFEAIHNKFASSSTPTKALLLSAYVKMFNLYADELGPRILEVLRQYATSVDAEIQQRACEYFNLMRLGKPDLVVSPSAILPSLNFANIFFRGIHFSNRYWM